MHHDWHGVFLLLCGLHFLADYPLQADFLSTQKDPQAKVRIIPWYHAMTAHCAIHALFVGIVLGSYTLAVLEFIFHFWADYTKCRKGFGIHFDQFFHILCKAVWVCAAYFAFVGDRLLW